MQILHTHTKNTSIQSSNNLKLEHITLTGAIILQQSANVPIQVHRFYPKYLEQTMALPPPPYTPEHPHPKLGARLQFYTEQHQFSRNPISLTQHRGFKSSRTVQASLVTRLSIQYYSQLSNHSRNQAAK